MKTFESKRVAAAVCLALAATVLGGCAAAVVGGATAGGVLVLDRRSPGTQLSDQSIELRASSRVNDEVLGDGGHVNIVSYYRKVLITGEVPSEAARQKVQLVVGETPEVEAVVNELAVLPNTTMAQRSNDTLVTGRVKARLLNHEEVPANSVKVVTERGTTYLVGRLTQRETELVTELARTTSGVQRVVRLIDLISEESVRPVQSGPEPAPVSNATQLAPGATSVAPQAQVPAAEVTVTPVSQPTVIQQPALEVRPLPSPSQ